MAKTIALVNNLKELNNADFQARLVRGTFAFVLVFGLLYAYFVVATIVNVVERRGYEEKIKILSGQLSLRETEYLDLSNKMNISRFTSLGFKETDPEAFVTRGGGSVAVTLTR